jgi:ferritin
MTHSKTASPVLIELNRQFNRELAASHGYLALSVWCEIRNFKGFAAFFAKQNGEEKTHSRKIIKYLIDRGHSPEVASVPEPQRDFSSLLEVAQHAQAMERANTAGIHAAYEAALAAKDYPAQVLMHWFISEQVEEEAWCAEMVERVQSAACAGSLSSLDRHIEKLLTQSVVEADEAD